MPRINELNVKPCRETIREIFMQNIIYTKGMEQVQEKIGQLVMPTPAAVLKAAETFSKGSKKEKGAGDLVLVDIGGATTDIHSIDKGWPSNPAVSFKGLEEPLAKRTVEGDLGIRYSSKNVVDADRDIFMEYIGDRYDHDIDLEIEKRISNPSYIADIDKDLNFDLALAKVCSRLSMTSHAGKVSQVYSPVGLIYQQEGKDLLKVPMLIGTGGVLVSTNYPRQILEECLYRKEDVNSLKPQNPEFYIDEKYILSAMGLLSMIDEDMAIRIMRKNLKKI